MKLVRDMICASIAGSICQVLTNPIWVIRVRMQSESMHGKYAKRSLWYYVKDIYKNEGMIGFYKGTIASLMGKISLNWLDSILIVFLVNWLFCSEKITSEDLLF